MIRLTDRYIGKQVLLGTLYAVAILGIVLVLGNLFKQIKPLLVDSKAPLGLVLRFVLTVLPVSLMYTVPWGFLSAVLLVFGRLSTHQEITALRVAGVSLPRLAMPVFVCGALLSAASLWLNVNVVPISKASLVQLVFEQASRDPDSLLKPGVVQGSFRSDGGGTQKALIEGKSGEWVEGFHFYQISDEPGGQSAYVHARRAALAVDRENGQLRVKLEDAYFETRRADGRVEMGFAGLAEPLVIDLRKPRRTRASALTNDEIREMLANESDIPENRRLRMASEIAKRYSFSMACFAFAFVGVPLGIGARRRDTSSGLILSLAIGAGYFLLTMLAEQFDSARGAIAMLWVPNIACVLLGLILFRRARFR